MPLSRRTLLRATGAALALPYLEAMLPARSTTSVAPRRLVFVYAPNGVHMPDWTPTVDGELAQLPPLLAALEKHRSQLLVISGLAHDKARANGDGPGDHARAAATFLTGCQALKTDGPIRAGVSADQHAARALGNRTRVRSLELGLEAGRLGGQCDSGYSCAYSNSIAWSGANTPMGKEVDPRTVFDRLFRADDADLSDAEREARRARRRSVLDFVREDAQRLAKQLGAQDARKLDEYLSGVRELERRIDFAVQRSQDARPELARPNTLPEDFAEHAQLMNELLALALLTDTTRIATFMLGNEGSNRSYPSIEVPEGHHELSHHGGDAQKLAKIAAINRLHVAQFAHLLDRFAAPDGDAPLLERCVVAYGSAISDGNRHNHDELPVLVAGGGGGRLRGGRHLRCARETPCANLWLSLLDCVDVVLPALGDSNGRLEGLGA
jgi:hypothetical protein